MMPNTHVSKCINPNAPRIAIIKIPANIMTCSFSILHINWLKFYLLCFGSILTDRTGIFIIIHTTVAPIKFTHSITFFHAISSASVSISLSSLITFSLKPSARDSFSFGVKYSPSTFIKPKPSMN